MPEPMRLDRRLRHLRRVTQLCALALLLVPAGAGAATIAPPMLDITRQCDVTSRHNVTAMSECVVAESEARAEILQRWEKLSDAAAGKCIKIGRKARKFPYTAMEKCLALEPLEVRAPQGAAAAVGVTPISPPPAGPATTGPAPISPAPINPAPSNSATSKFPYFSIPHF